MTYGEFMANVMLTAAAVLFVAIAICALVAIYKWGRSNKQ